MTLPQPMLYAVVDPAAAGRFDIDVVLFVDPPGDSDEAWYFMESHGWVTLVEFVGSLDACVRFVIDALRTGVIDDWHPFIRCHHIERWHLGMIAAAGGDEFVQKDRDLLSAYALRLECAGDTDDEGKEIAAAIRRSLGA